MNKQDRCVSEAIYILHARYAERSNDPPEGMTLCMKEWKVGILKAINDNKLFPMMDAYKSEIHHSILKALSESCGLMKRVRVQPDRTRKFKLNKDKLFYFSDFQK